MAPPVPRPEDVKRPRTEADRLKAAGVAATRESLTRVAPEVLTLIREKDHPLYDPRVDAEVDPALVADEKYKAWAADVEANGVRQAILVRRNGVDDKNVPILQVVEGRQRTKFTVWLNATKPLPDGKVRTVPIKYEDGDDGEMVLISLSHKLGRDEQPFSRAWKIRTAKKLGRTDEEIAQACGWSARTGAVAIKEHLAILSMIEEVQQSFNSGELPASCIKVFMNIPREEQPAALAKVREVRAANGEGGISTAEVKAATKAARTGAAYQAPKKIRRIDPEWLHRVKDALEKQLPNLTTMQVNGGGAELTRALGQMEGALALARFLCGDGQALEHHVHLLTAMATATAPSQAA